MKTLQTEREAIVETLAKQLHAIETDWGDGCYVRGEDVDKICDELNTALLSHEEKVVARVREEEQKRIETILKKWMPTDYRGYGVNLASKGMHLDDHKRNFAKSILEALTLPITDEK